ncbi:MAG: hypothetical protein HONBIEJF_01725 [Fimbriimonadaceae bacterium]|nr:hypothetical protein [Fimbriimonadaceae bacterium]
MNPKPPKSADLVLAERLLLVTLCIRNAVNQGQWEDLPAYFSERQGLMNQVELLELGEEARACLERIQDESRLIFAEIRRERASILNELRACDAGARTRSAYRTGPPHRGACDELT